MTDYSKVHWGDRGYKTNARLKSIIDPCIDILKQQQLDPEKQFWSLCGTCTDDDNNPHYNSEPAQLLSSKFIQPNQYHGVDRLTDVITNNKTAFPILNWYNDDFYNVLTTVDHFNPGIINIDSVNMPSTILPLATDIISLCNSESIKPIILLNMVTDVRRYKDRTINHQQLQSLFNNDTKFIRSLYINNWSVYKDSIFQYHNPISGTEMTTIILY